MWEWEALRLVWCMCDSVRAHKQVHQPVVVRHSRRHVPRTIRLGVLEYSNEMEGEEESAETKTEDEYSPRDVLLGLCCRYGFDWDFCLGWLGFR